MSAYVPPHRRAAAATAAPTHADRSNDARRLERRVQESSTKSAASEIFTGGVAVVNLRRRPDRLRRFAASAARALGSRAWSRFEAVDGAAADARADGAFEARWDATQNAAHDRHIRPGPRRATDGERGCALSHVALWRRVAALDDAAWFLVCEDDCAFRDFFDGELRRAWPLLPPGADLVYLGLSDRGERTYDVAGRVFAPAYGFGTHCYAIRAPAARRLLEHLPVAGPVDVWLADNAWFGATVRCVVKPGGGWENTGRFLCQQDAKPGDADVRQSSRDAPLAGDAAPPASVDDVAAALSGLDVDDSEAAAEWAGISRC